MKKIFLIPAFIFPVVMCMAVGHRPVLQKADLENEKKIIDTYIRSARNHYNTGNYYTTYELLLKGLQLSEKFGDTTHLDRLYSNIGAVYYHFNSYDLARFYYVEALKFCRDSTTISIILNNLGHMEVKNGKLDNAFYFLNQSLQIVERRNTPVLSIVLHSLAEFYKEKKMYDSACHYYKLSLDDAEKMNNVKQKAESSSDLGKLFFEMKKTDLAIHYIGLSNVIAAENTLLGILMENYLVLSEIAYGQGHRTVATEYFKQYFVFKDSIANFEKTAQISQLQRLHEALKMDQQIEQFTIEQQINKRVVRYQRIIQIIMLTVLILISIVLAFVFAQNRRLNMAYNKLVEKNIEVIELQESSSEIDSKKYQNSAFTDEMQNELLARIYSLMDDVSVVCDPELSVEKLANLLQSNRTYVSQVINDILKKNFRALINDYRVREAQRLFSESDASKYTIEFVALKTGFKSRSTFIAAFKEVTGVNPSFYLKSMQKR